MKHAPIVVSVYDRPGHFKACVESLAQNKGAEHTSLFISSDGPRDAVSAEKVGLVRDYIKTITGFNKVISFAPAENTAGEIKLSVYEKIKSDFSRYIRTEDDNIFSPYALKYFNQGLEMFADDPRIHAVCGYIYPKFPSKGHEQIYLRCLSAWGIALWRDKDIYPYFDEKRLAIEVFGNQVLFDKVCNYVPNMVPMIKSIIDGELKAGDVARCAYLIKNDQLSVFPSVSVVRNIGNDGTGEHCGINKVFEKQKVSDQEIQFDMFKPREPAVHDEKWIVGYFGGKKEILRNKLLFAHFNTPNNIRKLLIKTFLFMLSMVVVPSKIWRRAMRMLV